MKPVWQFWEGFNTHGLPLFTVLFILWYYFDTISGSARFNRSNLALQRSNPLGLEMLPFFDRTSPLFLFRRRRVRLWRKRRPSLLLRILFRCLANTFQNDGLQVPFFRLLDFLELHGKTPAVAVIKEEEHLLTGAFEGLGNFCCFNSLNAGRRIFSDIRKKFVGFSRVM